MKRHKFLLIISGVSNVLLCLIFIGNNLFTVITVTDNFQLQNRTESCQTLDKNKTPEIKTSELSIRQKPTRYTMLNDVNPRNDSRYYILFFNPCFMTAFWGLEKETLGEEDLKSVECPHTNCILTHKHDLLQNYHDFDGIIVNVWYSDFVLPETRTPRQRYILATNEAPCHIYRDLSLDDSIFNLTMTYKLHSDIVWNYGEVIDKVTGAVIAPNVNIQWREIDENFEDDELVSIARNKTRNCAWAVSNCPATSNRQGLVKKLQQFIDVDIYGGCGNLTCGNCDELFNSTYKFYLAFENAIFSDYVTEKLYKVLNSNVIPVVFNGAEMKHFMPPKSYVDVNDFSTAEGLANHLIFLSENPREYVKYFWWRKHYKGVLKSRFGLDHVCKICEKFNEPNSEFKDQVYTNARQWFGKNSEKVPNINF